MTDELQEARQRRAGGMWAWLCGVTIVMAAAWTAIAPGTARAEEAAAGETLKVLTFNVWHGRRQPEENESKKVFPGEDAERAARRFAWQIEEIRRLDPDVLLLQEVNPNQREARKYARALGYDEIHKVTSCGVHLGKLLKIPRNVNEGLAILARPSLGLRRVGWKRLSGNAWCTATFGLQTRESRFALFGEIEAGGRKVLVASTHLYSPAFMPPNFREDLDALVERGVVTAEHRTEIHGVLDDRQARNVREIRDLLAVIETRRARLGPAGRPAPAILGGDFNTEPGTPGVAVVLESGFAPATASELPTWDPVANEVNYQIGTKRSEPFDTREIPELIELLAPRSTLARQIDHIFGSPGLETLSAERALDRDREGIYPSDHFAILATLRLP